jgi:hypothetical protein
MLKHRMHKAEAVTGDRKTLHTDELHDLCYLPDSIRMISQGGRDGWDTWSAWGHNATNVVMQVPFTDVMTL